MAEEKKNKAIVLNIGSISENCSVFIDDEEQIKLRLERLAEEIARSGLLREVGFGWRWDGSKKQKISFKASGIGTEVGGSLMCANGVATLRMSGRVEIRGLPGGKVNEGKIQAMIRGEAVKSLRAAWDQRTMISSVGAVDFIRQKAMHMIRQEIEARQRQGARG